MKRLLLTTLAVCVLCFGCAHTAIKSVLPEMYRAPYLNEFESAAEFANRNYVFAIGSLEDRTGKFLDGDQLRYSRTVTQAARDLVGHFMFAGGFVVAERDPYNIQLITQEYKMAHTYIFDKDGKVKEQAGLIKRSGPAQGLTGATHIVTGAITTYQVSNVSGGGGVEVDAIGVQIKYVKAVVGVQLRIVNLATSEVVCSALELATVEGKKIGMNGFKLITHKGDIIIASAEVGLATQFPADFALSEAMISGLSRLLTAKGTDFYTKKIDFKR